MHLEPFRLIAHVFLFAVSCSVRRQHSRFASFLCCVDYLVPSVYSAVGAR